MRVMFRKSRTTKSARAWNPSLDKLAFREASSFAVKGLGFNIFFLSADIPAYRRRRLLLLVDHGRIALFVFVSRKHLNTAIRLLSLGNLCESQAWCYHTQLLGAVHKLATGAKMVHK